MEIGVDSFGAVISDPGTGITVSPVQRIENLLGEIVLADQVGMSKSGLFAHFRSKEDVQIELLTHMAEFVMEHVLRPSMTAGEGLPRLRALYEQYETSRAEMSAKG